MPMPLAAALYGVLLGLGFTTFVLSFGVWALAGVSLALGDPELGLLIGVAFGVGRALPIVVLAPQAGGRVGIKATELMCEREGVYLGLRRGDAAALLIAGLALIVAPGGAGARGAVSAKQATDPSATTDSLVYQRLSGQGVLRRGGGEVGLNGSNPTIGGAYVATLKDGVVTIADRNSLAPIADVPAPQADAIAVGDVWLAYRAALGNGGDGIFVRNISNPVAPGPIVQVAGAGGSSQLSPPSLDGYLLLFGLATQRGSRIVQRVLGDEKASRPDPLAAPPALRPRGERQVLHLHPDRREAKPPDDPPPPRRRPRQGAPRDRALRGDPLDQRSHSDDRLRHGDEAERDGQGRHHRACPPRSRQAPAPARSARRREPQVLTLRREAATSSASAEPYQPVGGENALSGGSG